MRFYGNKRVCGRGYENRNIVVRKRKRREEGFFLFLALFGATVYFMANVLFRSLLFGAARPAVTLVF